MTAALRHRGPDGVGQFFDPQRGIGFGHRRLSIVDLSDAGQQPMWSKSGRFCIAYNGEVYNAPEIREELEQQGVRLAWSGHSDTEVALEAIEALGLENALQRFRGMFAFALWDSQTKNLFLVRDRLGIKPLLYTQGPFGIAFTSELQALYQLPPFRGRLDRSTVASFLQYGVVPGDQCILEGVRKVAPGTIVRFSSPRSGGAVSTFWSAQAVAAKGIEQPFGGTAQEAIDELERRVAALGDASHAFGCPLRGISVGRDRFVDRGRADATKRRDPRQDVLHRQHAPLATTRRVTQRQSRAISAQSTTP